MLDKIKKYVGKVKDKGSKLAVGAGLLATLGCAGTRDHTWMNLRPGYDVKNDKVTLRFEGRRKIIDQFSIYGKADVNAIDRSKDEGSDFEEFRGRAQANYTFGDAHKKLEKIGVALEYDGGSGIEDVVKGGITFTPFTGNQNYLQLKAFPFSSSDDRGRSIGVQAKQILTDKFDLDFETDYDFDEKKLRGDLGLNAKVADNISLFGSLEGALEFEDKIKDTDTAIKFGIRIDF
jgi:hypothetical protein